MTGVTAISNQTSHAWENRGKALSLLELNRLVREVIDGAMPNEYWVEAELSDCRESRGHCYMELIQRDERAATPVARASAKCWASKWMIVRPYFERITRQQLRAGMKVMLRVYAQFHEAYGFSWIVTDIDPNYTLGDQARRRQEIIRRLKEEGVFDMQRELHLPMFCQNIAVISSQTAAGYGDFSAQLSDSPFAFTTRLFPAVMQGEGVEKSIVNALEQIYSHQLSMADCQFDAVVIIRGGGATSDMSGFDTLELAENVANLPIPVITGIGHDRDECILDMVSHLRVKTPTAAAAFLIDKAQAVAAAIDDAQSRIARYACQRMADSNSRLSLLNAQLSSLFSVVRSRQEARLDQLFLRLTTKMASKLSSSADKLELLGEKLKAMDPTLLFKRGYSITLKDGKVVKDAKALVDGDQIETLLSNGAVRSVVRHSVPSLST